MEREQAGEGVRPFTKTKIARRGTDLGKGGELKSFDLEQIIPVFHFYLRVLVYPLGESECKGGLGFKTWLHHPYLFDHDKDQGEGKEMLTDPWPSLKDKF